ncbi:hypothetical protein PR048_029862, partial [Dryococelus australis]
MVVTDYYSRFFEIITISSLADEVVIRHLKEVFSRFGIPEIVQADNGTQFLSERFREFSSSYNFTSNDGLEAAVKVAKQVLKMMTFLPHSWRIAPHHLRMGSVHQKENSKTSLQADRYKKRHRVRQLEDLKVGKVVWISDLREYDTIEQIGPKPMSYTVRTSRGSYRHNIWFLVPAPYKDGNVVRLMRRKKPVDVNKEESDGEDFKGFEMDKKTESTEICTCGYTPSREGTLQTVRCRSDR